jgi:enoyl-[acyl-carrier protein] reductase II
MLKTRITELFGIKHPIMLAGMSWITEPKIVSAVSNAGGLGVLATGPLSPDETRKQIRKIKELTDKPFGINQSLIRPKAGENIDVAIEEKVPIINYSLGRPWFTERVHKYGGKVIGTVALVRHAIRAEQLGCDVLSITGHEAAAHGADATSLVLIPMIASAVKVPLLAAGGFYDGRGLAAALVLGADAVSMGTRFALTKESIIHESTKQLMLKATEQDTIYSDRFDGMPGRALTAKGAETMMRRKGFPIIGGIAGALQVRRMLKLSWWDIIRSAVTGRKTEEGLNIFQQLRFAGGTVGQQRAIYDGDTDVGFTFSGQAQGGVNDLPSIAELIERIVAEAEKILKSAGQKYAKH